MTRISPRILGLRPLGLRIEAWRSGEGASRNSMGVKRRDIAQRSEGQALSCHGPPGCVRFPKAFLDEAKHRFASRMEPSALLSGRPPHREVGTRPASADEPSVHAWMEQLQGRARARESSRPGDNETEGDARESDAQSASPVPVQRLRQRTWLCLFLRTRNPVVTSKRGRTPGAFSGFATWKSRRGDTKGEAPYFRK